MAKKLFIGLDISITSTGLCLDYNGFKKLFIFVDKNLSDKMKCDGVEYKKYDRKMPKDFPKDDSEMVKLISYENLSNMVLSTIENFMFDYKILPTETFIFYEKPSLQSKGQAALEIPIINALIRRKLLSTFPLVNFKGYAPTSLKKEWTGSGRAKKTEMESTYNEKISQGAKLPLLVRKLKSCKLDDIIDAIALVEIHK